MTAIDPLAADLSAKAAAKLIPGHPNHMTVWRWMTRGVRGIKLPSVIIAGERRTSREALREFLIATSEPTSPNPARNSNHRQRAVDSAIAELEQAGL